MGSLMALMPGSSKPKLKKKHSGMVDKFSQADDMVDLETKHALTFFNRDLATAKKTRPTFLKKTSTSAKALLEKRLAHSDNEYLSRRKQIMKHQIDEVIKDIAQQKEPKLYSKYKSPPHGSMAQAVKSVLIETFEGQAPDKDKDTVAFVTPADPKERLEMVKWLNTVFKDQKIVKSCGDKFVKLGFGLSQIKHLKSEEELKVIGITDAGQIAELLKHIKFFDDVEGAVEDSLDGIFIKEHETHGKTRDGLGPQTNGHNPLTKGGGDDTAGWVKYKDMARNADYGELDQLYGDYDYELEQVKRGHSFMPVMPQTGVRGGQLGYGATDATDPTIMVILIAVMVCLCFAFVCILSGVSCVGGYVMARFMGAKEGNNNKNKNEYEIV